MNKQIKRSYYDEVMMWGNLSPWKRLSIRISHQTTFQPDEVIRDGKGNILKMPLLRGKPCFGCPSAVFRHGKVRQKVTLRDGRSIVSRKHQCGSCPEGVRMACIETALERVKSDPHILSSFEDWRSHCNSHYGGELTYTGAASCLWVNFKKAVAARGPFTSTNDAALEEIEARNLEDKRRKWVSQKRQQRKVAREIAQNTRSRPSQQYLYNLQDERDNRHDDLLAVLGMPDQPPSRSKVPADKREATAQITANAWAIREFLRMTGEEPKPGKIARLMTENGLSAGTPLGTLKARIINDLKRADECEKDGLWQPFDPDSDLASCATGDDDTADAYDDPPSEIDLILRDFCISNELEPS